MPILRCWANGRTPAVSWAWPWLGLGPALPLAAARWRRVPAGRLRPRVLALAVVAPARAGGVPVQVGAVVPALRRLAPVGRVG